MEKEVTESEEHNDEVSLRGAKLAKHYLQDLLKSPNRGLLEHEIIIAVNNKVLNINKRDYSQNQRMTTFKGREKMYCKPEDINVKMQIIIDRFNEQCAYRNAIHKALAEFVFDFLDIHPFSDGNGRTIKCIIWYVLKSFQKLNHFHCLKYPSWCDIIDQKSYEFMYKWFEDMQ